jgi:hypothetical protein
VALPAAICNFTEPVAFFAIVFSPICPSPIYPWPIYPSLMPLSPPG